MLPELQARRRSNFFVFYFYYFYSKIIVSKKVVLAASLDFSLQLKYQKKNNLIFSVTNNT